MANHRGFAPILVTVKMPREGVLDSKLINYASKLVVEQVDRLNSGFRSYDPKAFAAEIRKMLGTENGTLALTRRARHFSLGTNTATFMLGALDVPIKEPKERQRRAKDVIQEETTAQDVDDLEADNKNEATKRVEELNAHLPEENSDMNFWEYVYDGDEEKGFGRTIENIFYSSFLVRDGHAGIDVSERHPSVSAKVAPLAQDYVDRRATKHQCVVQFDYKTWLKLRDSFGDRTYLPPPIAEYVSEAAASTKKKPGSAKKDSQANGNKKVVKKSAASSSQASVTSPNAKKRGRLSLESQESENGEMDGSEENGVSQIEDTPAERLPTAKRRAV